MARSCTQVARGWRSREARRSGHAAGGSFARAGVWRAGRGALWERAHNARERARGTRHSTCDESRRFIGRLQSACGRVRMRECWMAAEKRAALVVSQWLKESVGRDRTLTNQPQEEEELRGRAERFFSHLFVDFPSLTRLMLLHAGDAAPLKCLICSRRRFGSLRELRKHAHRGTRRERRAEHLGYYDALLRARLPRYYNAQSSSSEEEG